MVIDDTTAGTLRGFIRDHVADGSTVYTDGAEGYKGLRKTGHDLDHAIVKHSVGEYVRGEVHTNGMEGKRLMYSDLTAGEQVFGPAPGTFIRYA